MPNENKLESIEALRGIAALSVLWFHFTAANPLLPAGSFRSTGLYGWLGVEVFFVISGFIIPFAMRRANYSIRHFGCFIGKRLIRLEPPYVVSVLLCVALLYVSSKVPGFRGQAPHVPLSQVALHFGYLIPFTEHKWLNPVFWTLAIEFQYYLLIALAFPLIAHSRFALPAALCFSCLALTVRSNMFIFHYAGLFALGMVAFQRHQLLISDRVFLAAVVFLSLLTAVSTGIPEAIAGVATTLVIAAVPFPHFRVLAWLGTISYSLYLVHVPIGGRVLNLGARYAHTFLAHLAVLAIACVASVLAAFLVWQLVERPAQRWSSKLRYRNSPTFTSGSTPIPRLVRSEVAVVQTCPPVTAECIGNQVQKS